MPITSLNPIFGPSYVLILEEFAPKSDTASPLVLYCWCIPLLERVGCPIVYSALKPRNLSFLDVIPAPILPDNEWPVTVVHVGW